MNSNPIAPQSFIIAAVPAHRNFDDYLKSRRERLQSEREKLGSNRFPADTRSSLRLFLQEIWATSREAAQQAAIELSQLAYTAAFFRVLAIPRKLTPTLEEEILSGGLPQEWERIKRDTPCKTWWAQASMFPDEGRERVLAVRSGRGPSPTRAIEQAAYDQARKAGEWDQEGYHDQKLFILCVPATLAERAPVEGSRRYLWLPNYDEIPDSYTHTVNPAPYRVRIARTLSPPSFTGILPSDFRDRAERMHYRHAALRHAVVDMCYALGEHVITSFRRFNAASTMDANAMERLEIMQDTCAARREMYDFLRHNDWFFKHHPGAGTSWQINEGAIAETYHSLRPVDLLRYSCPDLDSTVVEEWALRFPWEPTFLVSEEPYDERLQAMGQENPWFDNPPAMRP